MQKSDLGFTSASSNVDTMISDSELTVYEISSHPYNPEPDNIDDDEGAPSLRRGPKAKIFWRADKPPSKIQTLILTEEQSNEPLAGWSVQKLDNVIQEYWSSELSGYGVDLDLPGYNSWLRYFIQSGLHYGDAHAWVKALITCPLRFLSLSTNPLHCLLPEYFDSKCEVRVDSRLAGFKEPELDARGYVVLRPGMNYARRLWDVFANRVIPECWVPQASIDPISHAWVHHTEIQYVWTPINHHTWPVPIPRGTLLEDVRQELLTFGVQYTWLDVLCLRQTIPREFIPYVGGETEWEKRETQRLKEWESDVPLIGGIYLESRKVVGHLSGLGRPLTPKGWDSERHWIRRAWTLQEVVDISNLLIAGIGVHYNNISVWRNYRLTNVLFHGQQMTMNLQETLALNIPRRGDLLGIPNMDHRCASNSLDKVSGLFFILAGNLLWTGSHYHGNVRVPRYLPDMDPDEAWCQLVHAIADMNAPGDIGTITMDLLTWFPYPSREHWFPSWNQALKIFTPFPEEQLHDAVPPKADYSLLLSRGRIYRGCKLHRNPMHEASDDEVTHSNYILSYQTRDKNISKIVEGELSSAKDQSTLFQVGVGSYLNLPIPEIDDPAEENPEYVIVDITSGSGPEFNADLLDEASIDGSKAQKPVSHALLVCRNITQWRPYQARTERVYLRRVTTIFWLTHHEIDDRVHNWLPLPDDPIWGISNDLSKFVTQRERSWRNWIRPREVYLQ